MAGPVQKASLKIEDGDTLACLFNPKDFSVTKSNAWEAKAAPGKSAAKPTFGGGQPRELTLQLLFDSTLLTPAVTVKDVANKLFEAMNASKNEGGAKNKSRPPTLTFTWGAFSFEGVSKSLTIAYQLFRPDGEPIRADVKLALMQWDVEGPAGQNPTTRSANALGAHIVRDGDSLPSIAYRIYGDPTQWRAIAEANGIDDPLKLTSGRSLSVPSLDV
ncbi:MAG: LysM peptidoglycan-binding domain-containing protein [Solirubrobacterales bacterium]|nr:LysM peptidoglycan-binding domain-containing protein [Solirubrobacterales bacterium]